MNNISDKDVNKWFSKHKFYKINVIFGIILWMFAPFWLTFIIGCFIDIKSNIEFGSYNLIFVNGLSFMMINSFISNYTIPISTAYGAFVRPFIIRIFIFNKKYPFSEEILKEIKWSNKKEHIVCTSAFAGTSIGSVNNIINNRNNSN